MNATELLFNKRQTLAMIGARPITVSLLRPVPAGRNARGGLDHEEDPSELPPQTFAILHQPPRRRRLENNPPNASTGEINYAKDLLLGRWDADIQSGDTFTSEGVEYKVTYVFWDHTYETLANIGTMNQ